MRGFLIVAVFAFMSSPDSNSESNRCVFKGKKLTTIPEIVRAIQQQPNCSSAIRLAEDCAWASGADAQITEPAFTKCQSILDRNPPTQKEQRLFEQMQSACVDRFAGRQGSENVSLNIYCHLTALGWVVNLTEAP